MNPETVQSLTHHARTHTHTHTSTEGQQPLEGSPDPPWALIASRPLLFLQAPFLGRVHRPCRPAAHPSPGHGGVGADSLKDLTSLFQSRHRAVASRSRRRARPQRAF